MTSPQVSRPIRRVGALTAAVVLGVLALMLPRTAGAAGPGPQTTATVTGATAATGLELHLVGTGYDALPNSSTGAPASGIYVALRDPATMPDDAINAEMSIVPASTFIPKAAIIGGAWSVDLGADAAALSPDADYEVIVWVAHGNITAGSLLSTVPVVLTDAQSQALFPGWTPPTSTTTPGTTGPTTTTPTPTTATSDTTGPTTTTGPAGTAEAAGLRCVAEQIPGTAGAPSLSWGIKSSFVSYIEGIANGQITASGGVTRTHNTFTWSSGSGDLDASGSGTWSFPGTLRFTGHDGALDITMTNLRIQVAGSTGTAIADIASHDTEGNDVGGNDIALATLGFSGVNADGGTASATFTAAGARAFGGVYSAGESMDPLTVSVTGSSTGGTIEKCYDAAGNLVSSTPTSTGTGTLAATGADTGDLIGVGAALIVLGGAALILSERRRRGGVTAP